jgi:hypothetical protein
MLIFFTRPISAVFMAPVSLSIGREIQVQMHSTAPTVAVVQADYGAVF